MALGTPYTIVSALEVVSTGTTYQVTVTASTTQGDCIAACALNNGTTVTGVTDSQGNVYVLAESAVPAGLKVYVFVAAYGPGGSGTPTAPLVSGTDWIKATYTTLGASSAIGLIARGCSGILPVSPVDANGTATATNTSASPAVTGTATLACASEWIVAALGSANTSGSPTGWSDSFAQAAQQHQAGEPFFTVADEVVSATTAQAAAATITSSKWALAQVALQAAPAPAPAQQGPFIARPRTAPARARLGSLGRCAAGVAVAVAAVTLGLPANGAPPHVQRPAPSRARWAGLASQSVTPLGMASSPPPRPVIQHRPQRRAIVGNNLQCGDGVASQVVTPLGGPPFPASRPVIQHLPARRAVWRSAAGPPPGYIPPAGPAAVNGALARRSPAPHRARVGTGGVAGGPAPGPSFFTLTNNAEGGTSGVTVTTGNSGGASGRAWDVVTIGTGCTSVFDNSQAAHGLLSYKIATGSTSAEAYNTWTTASVGSQTQVWFRLYLYFPVQPTVTSRVFTALGSPPSSLTCAALSVLTNGTLQLVDSAFSTVFVTTHSIPIGAWFRVEGYVTGSATAGQAQLRLFDSLDSTAPTETQTSAATHNLLGNVCRVTYGIDSSVVNAGPYWYDDAGLTNIGYMGPVLGSQPSPAFRPFIPRRAPRRALAGNNLQAGDGIASQVTTPLGSLTSPAPRPVIQHLAPRRARVGNNLQCGDGIAVQLFPLSVTPGQQHSWVSRSPAPRRALAGNNLQAGDGIASQVSTPRGSLGPPRPFVARIPGRRAIVGNNLQPGDGVASAIVTPRGSATSPQPRPVIQHRLPRRAIVGNNIQVGDGIASGIVVPLGSPSSPAARPVIQHLAQRRALVGNNLQCGDGLASQVVTPRGATGPPRPFVTRITGHRAVLGPRSTAGAGAASGIVTPRGAATSPPPRPVIVHVPQRRAVTGPAGRNAGGVASQVVTPPGRASSPPPRPVIQHLPSRRAHVGHGTAGAGVASSISTPLGSRPFPAPRPVIQHLPPRRAIWRGPAPPVSAPGRLGKLGPPRPFVARGRMRRAVTGRGGIGGGIPAPPLPVFAAFLAGDPGFRWSDGAPGLTWPAGSPVLRWSTGAPVIDWAEPGEDSTWRT